jgi:hypothetical protein
MLFLRGSHDEAVAALGRPAGKQAGVLPGSGHAGAVRSRGAR